MRPGPGPLVVVGDALLDQDVDGEARRLAADAPAPVVDVADEHLRPGGAALAAALAALRAGDREVVLVTALGRDPASEEIRSALAGRVRLEELPLDGSLPVKTRVRAAGRPLVRIDRGGGTPGAPTEAVRRLLERAGTVLVSDYGGGTAAALRPLLGAAAHRAPLLWDPHPRGEPPVPAVCLAVPNAAEARTFAAAGTSDGAAPRGDTLADTAARAVLLRRRWQAAAVVVTLGAHGALLTRGDGDPMVVPPSRAVTGDPCGAGDCFAAAAAAALAGGALPEEAVQTAVEAATAFVAADERTRWRQRNPGPGDGPAGDAFTVAASVRAAGGTVV
ncbi:PfkB family carbohydrate kinase, partial [Streptacidiphilus griseoplanus]|uniref:PfkB family carbohydrate kinase n=1 Tax=Peterkaempfera griseoplana TaxID=66896 RepID=UPI000AE13531